MPSTDAEEATGVEDQSQQVEPTSVPGRVGKTASNCLEADEEEYPLQNQDPFLALKNAERLAASIAERLSLYRERPELVISLGV